MPQTPSAPTVQIDHLRAPGSAGESLLQSKLLRLACSLFVLVSLFYGGYFLLAGLRVCALVIVPLALGAGVAAAYARRSGNHRRALDGLNLTAFAVIAAVAFLQDGINSPALHWLIVPLCLALLAGSTFIAATLASLSAAELALLAVHGPGSWATISMLAPHSYQQQPIAVVLSTLCLGLIVFFSARWTRGLQRALHLAREGATAVASAQARFVSHLSHEMRTPLQSLVGATDILRANHLARTQREQLAAIQSQGVKSLLEMLNAVLDFSKLEAGKMTLSVAALDLRSLVSEINEQFAVQAFSKGLELTSSCAPEVPTSLFGDVTRIRQVVANLVSNAVKFTAKGGVHIHVGAEAVPANADPSLCRISVEVKDTGVGLEPGSLPALFKPFHQADETVASRYGGTGLGLSISKSLAELMGGQIEVASAPGDGTAFTLRLPLRAGGAATRAMSSPASTAVALVAAASVGLSRHLRSRLEPLGLRVLSIEHVPEEADVGDAKLVFVDSVLLHDNPSAAASRLDRLVSAGTKVVVLSPLVGEPTAQTSAEILQVYKPVSRRALLALLDEQPQTESLDTAPNPGRTSAEPAGGQPVVLLAEDDPVNQLVVASMLAACDLGVLAVSDGQEALAVLKKQRVALVLTDIRMPGLDGIASTRALRQWERATESVRTPVIAMTGQYDAEQTEACLEAGMDEVLLKPFRLDVLRRMLQIHLRANN
jgi:two-component system, NarL family, sensor histidine kinase BarA